MDSVTQAVLGAAVGEAVLGRRVGGKAAAWGAVLGTVPDLDVFAAPFQSEVEALAFHRGFTHSFTFVLLAAPVFGWLLWRLYRREKVPWTGWAWLAFWAFLTHPLLDAFTSYGTQLFWPFSRYPVTFSTISIIDPLYTLPLLIGVAAALRRRDERRRAIMNYLGLGISSGYLLLTVINKQHVDAVFERSLRAQGVAHARLFTTPVILNNLLWTGVADAGETVWVGTYSILDDVPRARLVPRQANRHLLSPYTDQHPVQRLLWFAQGYFTVEQRSDTLYFHDLHLGWMGWLQEGHDAIFTFRLERDPGHPGRIVGFEQSPASIEAGMGNLRRFRDRVLGR